MNVLNIYNNLLGQAEKLFRHNRQGSYKTRLRYQEGFKRFLHYLAEHYRPQRLARKCRRMHVHCQRLKEENTIEILFSR